MRCGLVRIAILAAVAWAGPARCAYIPVWEYVLNPDDLTEESAGYAIDVAPDGSVVVGGVVYDGDFGASASRGVVMMLSTYGAVMWSTDFGTSSLSQRPNAINSVCVHPAGAVVVGGQVNAGGVNLMDGLVALLDGRGAFYWSTTFNGPLSSTDSIESVGVNVTTGEIYAAGRQARCAENGELWLTKLDWTSGDKLCEYTDVPDLFCRAASARAVVVDQASGDCYVAGYQTTEKQGTDGWVGRFDGSCPLSKMWSRTLDGALSSTDYASGVAMGAGGNPVVSGSQAAPGRYLDAWILSLASSTGGVLWSLTLDGGEGDDDEALACDSDGTGPVLVAGYVDRLVTGAFKDIWISKVSAGGATLWQVDRNTAENDMDQAEGVAVRDDSRFYVVGTITGKLGRKHLYVGAFGSTSAMTAPPPANPGYAYASPNPYRPGSGGDQDAAGITFRSLEPGAKVKLHSLTGALVAELEDTDRDGIVFFSPVVNDSGTELASGIYVFIVIPEQGAVSRGKVVIVR